MTTTNVLERADVPVEQTWNAESVYKNAEEWHAAYQTVQKTIPELAKYEGKLGESAETLVEFLEKLSAIRRRVAKLAFYAGMRGAVDSGDKKAKEMSGLARSLWGEFAKASSFSQPEILAIGNEKVVEMMNASEDLKQFRHLIQNMFRQSEHILSGEVETILGMLNDPFNSSNSIAGELTGTDMTFDDAVDSEGETFAITQSSIDIAYGSSDRKLRRSTWESYMDGYRQFENTLAAAYITSVKQNTFNMRVRGYDSVLQMQLFPHDIPEEVFHNLIDTFKENLPTWHRYWDVKRRALGLDELRPYDIWAPLTDNEPKITFEQAVNYVVEGMKPLGDEYINIMKRGCLEERWVDYSVNKGKRQGAFSYGSYDTHPFIMMSFDNQLSGMSTLAHELGHSMHSYLARANQPEHYAGYSMFVAETASNFNQAMTRHYLFETNNDRDFQLALIQEAMDNFHRYFFIMPTLARFELEVHQRAADGKPLTADILNGIMRDLYAEGYGDTMTDDPERTGITWATFGHLYTAYYTFQYATGISAAHAFAEKILTGEDRPARKYIQLLAAGGLFTR